MKVLDVYNYLDEIAPFSMQESWDNSGLLVGDGEGDVNGICVSLDFTADAVRFAVENSCSLLVTHHPAVFKPLKKITAGNPVYYAVKNGLSVICSHTCLDVADGGVNDTLCRVIGLENVRKLYSSDENSAIMRVGNTNIGDLREFARFVSEKLGGEVRFADCGKKVNTVGVCSGSGCSLMNDIVNGGCDTFLTGDASHHDFIDAVQSGINLIAAGHFATENPVVDVLVNRLREKFGETYVIKAEQSAPFEVINYGI